MLMFVSYHNAGNAGLCCKLVKPCPRIPKTVPFYNMEIEPDSITFGEKLGQGNFGVVKKGMRSDLP